MSQSKISKFFVSTGRPGCFSEKAWKNRLETTPWLFCNGTNIGCTLCRDTPLTDLQKSKGMRKALEWTQGSVGPAGTTDVHKASSFRSKISYHRGSEAHKALQKVVDERSSEQLPHMFGQEFEKQLGSTSKVFRTAYYIAKEEKPFTDHPKLIDLQEANGNKMGILLQSRKTGGDICEFIGKEMQRKMVKKIVDGDAPIGIMVDESTTSSQSSTLVICVRSTVNGELISFFLDLVEVESTASENILTALLDKLRELHMDQEWLKDHLICFASDGASNMTGKNSGVAVRLKELFPNIILWHCANHRLELAVGDAIKDADGINNFRVFMDKLFTLYHASPKNRYELQDCAHDLEQQVYTIGRVLDTRWVSSSERTVQAVLKILPSLVAHFTTAKDDPSRKSTDRATYKGLLNHITSPKFIANLCLMADALAPLAELSRALQHRNINAVTAHKLIQTKVGLFQQMKGAPGEWYTKYLESQESDMQFSCGQESNITLTGRASIQAIPPGQFYQSMTDSLSSRLITTQSRRGERREDADRNARAYAELLDHLRLLEPASWPAVPVPTFGRVGITTLATWFRIADTQNLLEEWEIFKASMGATIGQEMGRLITGSKTIIVSTAECERAFSAMNDILIPTRNRLAVTRLSMLMLIKILGPDSMGFNPDPYVRRWLQLGRRSADATNSRKRQKTSEEKCYESLHKLFKD